MRPFQKKKIQSRQLEDVRQELKQIELIHLQTIMKTGNTIESVAAQEKLSNTNLRDRIGQDESTDMSTDHNMTLATCQLQQLQTDNLCLTGPSTTLSSAAQIQEKHPLPPHEMMDIDIPSNNSSHQSSKHKQVTNSNIVESQSKCL